METSRDKNAENEGATSIRLRYSRQFQSGGHTHTIDAETVLTPGASPERREQLIRELEAGVEQLARQITQRGARPAASEAPTRIGTAPTPRNTEQPVPQPAAARPAAAAAQPTAPLPVSETMPITPGSSKDRTITLPQFLNAIRKRWNISSEEAKSLLHVSELGGLNYREAFDTLRALKEGSGAQGTSNAPARTTQQQPVVEAPRQANRGAPSAPGSRPSANQAAPDTAPVVRATGASASRPESAPPSQPPSAFAMTQEPRSAASARTQVSDFTSLPKAPPIPIHLAEVRDITPSYGFEEEDEEEYELPMDNEEDVHRQAARDKLDELKKRGGDKSASAERLNVLNNVLSGQISEEQLEKLMKIAWNAPNKKRLKASQVEALISWAKEDYFVDEVESLLALADEEE